MTTIPLKNFKVGKCIYCFRKGLSLSREHIIPFGLNGELVLQKASCDECKKMTSKFERVVMRGILHPVRVVKNFKTYHGHTKKLPVWVNIAGEQKWISIPIEEYGAVIVLPLFAPPAYLEGSTSLGNQKMKIVTVAIRREGGMPVKEIKVKYGLNNVEFRFQFNPSDFVALIAKIAYGFSILCYGVDAFAVNNLLPLIKKESSDITMWFGSESSPKIYTNQISVELDHTGEYLLSRVSYFGCVYIVVVGKLK